MIEQVYVNKKWNESIIPIVTIVTPAYNRRSVIRHTFESVQNQTFRNIEYIIVDDGSTNEERFEDIAKNIFDDSDIQVKIIRKDNGGVHTARNIGIQEARGKFWFNIDSDDEMLPDAISKCLNAWESLSDTTNIREIVGRCIDQNGNGVGNPFPEYINSLSSLEALAECKKSGGEHYAMMLTSVLKENLFPEYPGVTFITENVLWDKLVSLGYKSYFINDYLRIYHTDTEVGYTNTRTKSIKSVFNSHFESAYVLNNWSFYNYGVKARLFLILRYTITRFVINNKKVSLDNFFDNLFYFLLFIPAIPMSLVYRKKYSVK